MTATPVLALASDGAYEVPAGEALQDSQELPGNLIQPSVTNRSRFSRVPRETLDELAENIKAISQLQPIVVRPIQAPKGQPQFEIVAGECRWFAITKILGWPKIRVIIKYLTDQQALQAQLFENLKRTNLHPLDEAEGFQALLKAPPGEPVKAEGLTLEEVMEKFKRGRTYVYQRLALLKLVPQVVTEFLAGKIDSSRAMLISRVPAAEQPALYKRYLQGFGGEPMTFLQLQQYIKDNHMLVLSKAPFKIKDESLLPKAGSCTDCSKRTGANPDLWSDLKAPDTCTEPSCFKAKKEAHQARLVAQAKDEGVKVISGKEAKKLMPDNQWSQPKGYLRLEQTHYSIDSSKPLSKLLGKDAPEKVLVECPHTHELVALVPQDAAMKVLKAKGVITSSRPSSKSADERAAEARRKADTVWRRENAADILKALLDGGGFDDDMIRKVLLPQVALKLWNNLGHDAEKRAEQLLGWEHFGWDSRAKAEKRITDLPDPEMHRAIVGMLLSNDVYVNPHTSQPLDHPPVLMAFNEALGYDVEAVKRERLAAIKDAGKPAEKKPPAKKAGVVKASARVVTAPAVKNAAEPRANPKGKAAPKPPARYHNPMTGETWSGRGLMPKWLSVAIQQKGRKLEDFDTQAPAAAAPNAPPAADPSGAAKQGGRDPHDKVTQELPLSAPAPDPALTPLQAMAAAGPKLKPGVAPPKGPGGLSPLAAWPFPSPAPEGFASGPTHWIGQKVKVKSGGRIGEIEEIEDDGTLVVHVLTAEHGDPPLRLMSREVIVLPSQTPPASTKSKEGATKA